MKATQGKKELRSGITTGACAAGAAYAAAKFLLTGELAGLVVVYNPQEMPIEIPIDSVVRTSDGARAVVIKDGGDDPDVTHGMEVVAEVKLAPGGELILEGGPGVGVVTKPGLQVPVGQPAINPVPEKMIRDALACFVTNTQGLVVTISVPGGDKVAVRTLNPRLGIQGGISILGTTGIVHPMSVEAFKDSLVPLIAQAVSLGLSLIHI